MNPRLVNLLGSFIGGTSTYALARLEFAMTFGDGDVPPILDRLPDASERTLREHWDGIEAQLESALEYVRLVESEPSGERRMSPAFGGLKRAVRELDQYARALRWVMTVTAWEDDRDEPPAGGGPRR